MSRAGLEREARRRLAYTLAMRALRQSPHPKAVAMAAYLGTLKAEMLGRIPRGGRGMWGLGLRLRLALRLPQETRHDQD